ncbi:TIM barrel protein [Candidatus Micrarchaeota archaeon]|nr:TIM barrel protein [Candidatus Micrarchaeota archaeon]
MPKKAKVRFGSAGIPHQCEGETFDAVKCSRELNLGALELEFVRGVYLNEESLRELRREAEKFDVRLSAHAPYWINCCSTEKKKQETTLRNLFLSAQACHCSGARVAVFHPGYYQGKTSRECLELTKERFRELKTQMDNHKIKGLKLGAETVGKKSQYGSLDECIELHNSVKEIMLVIDFAHLLARGDWPCKTESDYARLLEYVEEKIPGYTKDFHAHFSCINYSEKGERNHLPLEGKNPPPYKPLMKVLAENGYGGVIISESPKLEFDALKMQKEYLRYV